jgi:hypothetical protein
VLFGVIGFVLALPMLYELWRRFGTWTAPAVALVFVGMFAVSTIWIGPAIRGDAGGAQDATPIDHGPHHGG